VEAVEREVVLRGDSGPLRSAGDRYLACLEPPCLGLEAGGTVSAQEIMSLLEQVASKAKERLGSEIASWNKVFQFELSDGTNIYIEISGGDIKVVEGKHPKPTAVLRTDPETLLKILRGELDAMKAFMFGKLKITGNVIETMKLRKLLEAAK